MGYRTGPVDSYGNPLRPEYYRDDVGGFTIDVIVWKEADYVKIYDTETGETVKLPKMPDGVIRSVGISKSEKLMRFYVNGSKSPNNLYIYSFETGEYNHLVTAIA